MWVTNKLLTESRGAGRFDGGDELGGVGVDVDVGGGVVAGVAEDLLQVFGLNAGGDGPAGESVAGCVRGFAVDAEALQQGIEITLAEI